MIAAVPAARAHAATANSATPIKIRIEAIVGRFERPGLNRSAEVARWGLGSFPFYQEENAVRQSVRIAEQIEKGISKSIVSLRPTESRAATRTEDLQLFLPESNCALGRGSRVKMIWNCFNPNRSQTSCSKAMVYLPSSERIEGSL